MRRLNQSILALLLCLMGTVSVSYADTVTLLTGQTIEGTIKLQNDDVVIIQDLNGRKFQYMRADVKYIKVSTPDTDEVSAEPVQKEAKVKESKYRKNDEATPKKTVFMVELLGGATFVPSENTGGVVGANVLIGSKQLGGVPIFLGGGVGYQANIVDGTTYSLLPIFLSVKIPMLFTGQHTPILGVNIGYGVALSSNYLGGLHAGLDIGYRYTTAKGAGIYVGLFAQFQQMEIERTTIIATNGTEYDFTQRVGRGFVSPGLKFSFQF